MAVQKIIVEGQEITIRNIKDDDYISLTDMAKVRENSEPRFIIRNWLSNNNTLLFLEAWETINNLDFNRAEMRTVRLDAQDNSISISPLKYIERTNAIGIKSKSGRYGGTFAHIDIAFEFGSWLNPVFKMYLITEFKRLKSDEAKRLNQEFNEIRFLSKVNYTLQTKAIEENILPRLNRADKPFAYSSEADLINQVVFGMTAKQWREANTDLKGNIRDHATILELNILNNLQARNSELIDNGVEPELRYRVLLQIAQKQFERLKTDTRLQESGGMDLLN
ncbi:MAG: KilA-N domain-containing protein [Bacteroidia bacterium]